MRALRFLVVAVSLLAGAVVADGCAESPAGAKHRSPGPPAVTAGTLPASRKHGGADYRFSIAHGARIHSDPQSGSFFVASATPAKPSALVVAVHGHNATAWQEYRRWAPYAAQHGLGLVTVEWQTKWGRDAQFLDTATVYGLIHRAVLAEGTPAGRVLLHGFSMGSHQTYGLTTIDRRGPKLFAMTIAESGGEHDPAGRNPALRGTRWVLYCAGHDPWPQLSGCPAMRRARAYLQSNGARVLRFMVDPPAGHGGMMRNRRDVELALGDFTRALAGR